MALGFTPNKGGPETVISLTGCYLSDASIFIRNDLATQSGNATIIYNTDTLVRLNPPDLTTGISGFLGISTLYGESGVTTSGNQYFTFIPKPVVTGYSLRSGQVGEQIKISGLHLQTVTGLYFNNAIVSFTGGATVGSNYVITGIVPYVETSYFSGINIKVMNEAGFVTTGNFFLRPFDFYPLYGNPSGYVPYVTGSGSFFYTGINSQFIRSINGVGYLVNNAGGGFDRSLDWVNRQLLTNDAGLQSLDWRLRTLTDNAGGNSLDWQSRTLTSTGNLSSADWEYKELYDDAGNVALNWRNRSLEGTWTGLNITSSSNDGINLSGNLTQTGATLIALINAATAGVSSINTKSGILTITGAGNIRVFSDSANFIISGNTGTYNDFAQKSSLVSITGSTGLFVDRYSNQLISGNKSFFGQVQLTGNTINSGTISNSELFIPFTLNPVSGNNSWYGIASHSFPNSNNSNRMDYATYVGYNIGLNGRQNTNDHSFSWTVESFYGWPDHAQLESYYEFRSTGGSLFRPFGITIGLTDDNRDYTQTSLNNDLCLWSDRSSLTGLMSLTPNLLDIDVPITTSNTITADKLITSYSGLQGRRTQTFYDSSIYSEEYIFSKQITQTGIGFYAEVAQFNPTNGVINSEIEIADHSGPSYSKKYLLNLNYDDLNGVGWREILPISNSGPRAGNYTLDFGGNSVSLGNAYRYSIRLRNTENLTNFPTVYLRTKTFDNPLITELTGTGIDNSSLSFVRCSSLTQVQNNLGIGISNPAYRVHISGGDMVMANGGIYVSGNAVTTGGPYVELVSLLTSGITNNLYVDRFSNQSVTGKKTFNSTTLINSPFHVLGEELVTITGGDNFTVRNRLSILSFAAQPNEASLRNDSNYTAGFDFQLTTGITVGRLGRLYITGSPANSQNHRIRLWNTGDSANPIADATILNSSSLDSNNFKWATITPVTLSTGQTYVLGIDEYTAGDLWKDTWIPTLQSVFTNINRRYENGAGYPTIVGAAGNMFNAGVMEYYSYKTALYVQSGFNNTLVGINNNTPISTLDVSGQILSSGGNFTKYLTLSGVSVATGGPYQPLGGSQSTDHGDGINLSGNLTSTGQTLNNKINSLSGYWNNNPSGFITSVGSTLTGLGYNNFVPKFISNSGLDIGSLTDISGKIGVGINETKQSYLVKPTTATRTDGPYAVGFDFRVNCDMIVNRLGRLYLAQNSGNHKIRLWNSGNQVTPIIEANILNSSAADSDNFKWVNVPRTTLTSGITYVIAIDEYPGPSGDTWRDYSIETLQPEFSFKSRYGNISEFPTNESTEGTSFSTPAIEYTKINNPISQLDISGQVSASGGLYSKYLYLSGKSVTTGGPYIPLSQQTTFVTTGQTGNFGNGGGTTNNYSINSGSGIFIFRSGITSGVYKQFISFPTILDTRPLVITTISNSISNDLIFCQVSGSNPTGFWALFSTQIANTGYYLDVFASNSAQTGMATNVIVNNINNSTNYGDGINLSGNLTQTGSTIIALINAASAGVSSINTKSGILTLTGAGNVRVFSDSANFVISGNTGAYSDFAQQTSLNTTNSNLSTTNANLQNNSLNLSGVLLQTGVKLWGFGSILSGNLSQTGATLIGLINAASAGVSSINGASGVMNIIGAGTVSITTIGQTITASGNSNNGINLSGNITQTGNTLWNFFTTLSGNLISTGQNLQNQINALPGLDHNDGINLSGRLTQTGTNLLNSINLVSGNLTQTGVNILSYSNSTFATITNLNTTNSNVTTVDNRVTSLSGYTFVHSPVYNVGHKVQFISGWNNVGKMINQAGQTSVDWINRTLYNSDQAQASIDWANRTANDSAGITSLAWGTRTLIDPSNVFAADYEYRELYDTAGNESINWKHRGLSGAWYIDSVSFPSVTLGSAIATIDWSTSNSFTYTLGGNFAFNMSNARDGQTIVVRLINPSTYVGTDDGSHDNGWPNTIKWKDSTAPIQSASETDIYTFICFDTTIYGHTIQGFAT